MTLAIRPAVSADIPAITRIYAHAVEHGTASFELTPADEAEMARRMANLMEGGFPYLAAEVDGRLAGYAYAALYRERPAYRKSVEDSVYVAADMHRRGVGVALLNALIEAATARGFRQMIAVIGDSTRQAASIGAAQSRRIPPCRHSTRCRLQARPLARQRADAARARSGRDDGALIRHQ